MPSRVALAFLPFLLCALWGCGSSSSTRPSDPGPLVNNSKWVPTTDGDEVLGPPPEDAECALEPVSLSPPGCPDFPWPDDECVTIEPANCAAAYVPECEQSMTVLSVYTRMPDDRVNLCNWITLTQPSLRVIRAGDQVEVRTFHDALTAPVPGEARMTFVVADQITFDLTELIPWDSAFESQTWIADKDYPAGTPLLWHVNNHGRNEYMLIEVNVCNPETTDTCL
jgi:hypothetical protein